MQLRKNSRLWKGFKLVSGDGYVHESNYDTMVKADPECSEVYAHLQRRQPLQAKPTADAFGRTFMRALSEAFGVSPIQHWLVQFAERGGLYKGTDRVTREDAMVMELWPWQCLRLSRAELHKVNVPFRADREERGNVQKRAAGNFPDPEVRIRFKKNLKTGYECVVLEMPAASWKGVLPHIAGEYHNCVQHISLGHFALAYGFGCQPRYAFLNTKPQATSYPRLIATHYFCDHITEGNGHRHATGVCTNGSHLVWGTARTNRIEYLCHDRGYDVVPCRRYLASAPPGQHHTPSRRAA